MYIMSTLSEYPWFLVHLLYPPHLKLLYLNLPFHNICIIDDRGYVPFVVVRTTFSFPLSSLFTWFLTRVTRRVALLKQELIVISVHLSSFLFFSGFCFTHLTSKSCISTYPHWLWLCHRLPGIRSLCRGHYLVLLSSSVTFLPRVTRRVPIMEQELIAIPEHLRSSLFFSWVCIDQSFFDLNLQNVSVTYSSFSFDEFIVLIIGIASQCWYRVEFIREFL